MNKIKVLPISEAQKIAAGEVIERPANVVKELIENSLDASATNITLYLEDSGKKLIRIIDNGYGMSTEDAQNCILHHATSKITSIDDLDKIQTFGFRGEALSSIASVSKMNLITRNKENELGISLFINQAHIEKQQLVSSNLGTDISINDIFFNVPVRKKFLKTNETEWKNISQLFTAFGLSNLNISFKLYHNDKLIYNWPSVKNLQDRLAQIYDSTLIDRFLMLPEQSHNLDKLEKPFIDINLTGAISTPKYTRYDRNQIFLFVNKRWVKNYKLAQALINGYEGMLSKGQYPAGFIFIEIDTQEVDINIHPRKEEVKFLHPKIIENLIKSTVNNTLANHLKKSLGENPALSNFSNIAHPEHVSNFPAMTEYPNPLFRRASKDETIPFGPSVPNYVEKFRDLSNNKIKDEGLQNQINNIDQFAQILNDSFDNKNSSINQTVDSPKQQSIQPELNYKIIAQVLDTYILIETSNGLCYIDQHAAHERIIYEKLKNKNNDIEKIRLMFPQIINLHADIDLLLNYLDVFLDLGFSVEQFSKSEIIITQAPIFLKDLSFENIIKKTISSIIENQKLNQSDLKNLIIQKIITQLACSQAVKSGDILNKESMQDIITKLYETPNMLTCPHGRPTIWDITKFEIEKKFKRDYR